LPGTSTRMMRRPDGRNLVVLFNARVTPHVTRLGESIVEDLNKAIDEVEAFPATDLFDEYK
jgi:N-acyl-D-amino-acid deacylase